MDDNLLEQLGGELAAADKLLHLPHVLHVLRSVSAREFRFHLPIRSGASGLGASVRAGDIRGFLRSWLHNRGPNRSNHLTYGDTSGETSRVGIGGASCPQMGNRVQVPPAHESMTTTHGVLTRATHNTAGQWREWPAPRPPRAPPPSRSSGHAASTPGRWWRVGASAFGRRASGFGVRIFIDKLLELLGCGGYGMLGGGTSRRPPPDGITFDGAGGPYFSSPVGACACWRGEGKSRHYCRCRIPASSNINQCD